MNERGRRRKKRCLTSGYRTGEGRRRRRPRTKEHSVGTYKQFTSCLWNRYIHYSQRGRVYIRKGETWEKRQDDPHSLNFSSFYQIVTMKEKKKRKIYKMIFFEGERDKKHILRLPKKSFRLLLLLLLLFEKYASACPKSAQFRRSLLSNCGVRKECLTLRSHSY